MKPVKLDLGKPLAEIPASQVEAVKDRIVGRDKMLPVAAFNSSI